MMLDLIFGSSSVSMFTLLKNKNLKVKKFKGANILGLIKLDNENRNTIIKIVNQHKSNLNRLIFMFGEVDIHLSYYYNLLYRDIDLLTSKTLNFEIMSKKYLEFIDSLPTNHNCQKIIIGPPPSIELSSNELYNRLIIYNVYNKDSFPTLDHLPKEVIKKIKQVKQIKVYQELNYYLSKYCKIFNFKFVDMTDICLDKQNIVKKKMIHKFNKFNIHLIWEPIIKKLSHKCGYEKVKVKKKLKNTLKVFFQDRDKRNIGREERRERLLNNNINLN